VLPKCPHLTEFGVGLVDSAVHDHHLFGLLVTFQKMINMFAFFLEDQMLLQMSQRRVDLREVFQELAVTNNVSHFVH